MLRLSESEYQAMSKGRIARIGANSFKKGLGAIGAVKVSSHAQALAQLARKPELLKGKQEHYLQVRIFDYFERKHPDIYEHMCAYPAGGMRNKKVGAEMKAEGQVSGYPDIIIDLPKGDYHGARIEVKTEVGTLQVTQKTKLMSLHEQGYYCTARKGFDSTVAAILDYARLGKGEKLEHGQFDEKWLCYQCDKQ
jgi:hypothetical protein